MPLLRIPKRSYRSTDPFNATLDISHRGPADIMGVIPQWQITDSNGRVIAGGQLAKCNVPNGKPSTLGAFDVDLMSITTAGKLTVTAMVGEFINSWEIWVYPPLPEPTLTSEVVECERWEDAKKALDDGRTVIFHAYACVGPMTMPGKFQPVFWSPVWFPGRTPKTMSLLCDPQHPLLAGFPTEMHSNWQWYHLLENSRLFILDETPRDYRPLVQVIDNFARNHKIGVVFEVRLGAEGDR